MTWRVYNRFTSNRRKTRPHREAISELSRPFPSGTLDRWQTPRWRVYRKYSNNIIVSPCLSENIFVYLFRLVDSNRVQRGSAAVQHSHVKPADQLSGGGGRRSQLLLGTSSELQEKRKEKTWEKHGSVTTILYFVKNEHGTITVMVSRTKELRERFRVNRLTLFLYSRAARTWYNNMKSYRNRVSCTMFKLLGRCDVQEIVTSYPHIEYIREPFAKYIFLWNIIKIEFILGPAR